jgi:hypothetical protein
MAFVSSVASHSVSPLLQVMTFVSSVASHTVSCTPSPGDDICERSSRGGTFRPHSDHTTSHDSQGIPWTAEQKPVRLIGFVFASRLLGSFFPAPTFRIQIPNF